MRWHLIFIIVIFFLAIVGGAFAYHAVEDWSILDSFYFVVVTVTTIGYGDLVPRSVQGKIFTMFFAFFGVATGLYILSTIGSSLFKKHVSSKVSEIKRDVKKEQRVEKEVKDTIIKAVRRKR